MRASTALALAAASSATALAQTAAEQYPYGYWDVTLTSNYTGNHDGVRRNITLVFTDDNRIVSDEAKEYHCWSDFGSSTLTEQKHCDNQYLDFIIADKAIWSNPYLEIYQHFYWGGRGEPYPAHTVRGGVFLGDVLTCDEQEVENCEGSFKVNATTLLY
ncbi:hypothetical protein B0J12DRAFT_676676 [Macrophomina phaseolina]|uniref:AA1-like domain-containing protein n=1 Tax=Macrophomina phaseolina TaxID=35725 RepID=A0ABQ8FZM9_9PEZI|nr:hypothetical protein B0J12DRAFT_676676 [Macrophomina phaseolina]